MADNSHPPQSGEAKGQVIRWRTRLYYEPSDKEIQKVISRAFQYEDPRRILPKASVSYGHLLIKGLRKETYERITKILQILYPDNLLNLEYVHSHRHIGRNYLAVSNRHPLGRCLAKCLADSFARQINHEFTQLDGNITGGSTRAVAWSHGKEPWFTPSDPTGGFDDCSYCPDDQVRVMSHTFMPPILIYVVSRRELYHTRDKCMTLVRHNLSVASIVILSIDQVPQHNLEDDGPGNNSAGQQTYLPSLPWSTKNRMRHGDKVSVTVLRAINHQGDRYLTWPVQGAEIFPRPTEKKLIATFEDLALVPWSSDLREPEFCLSFDDLTARLYRWRTLFARLKENWKRRTEKRHK